MLPMLNYRVAVLENEILRILESKSDCFLGKLYEFWPHSKKKFRIIRWREFRLKNTSKQIICHTCKKCTWHVHLRLKVGPSHQTNKRSQSPTESIVGSDQIFLWWGCGRCIASSSCQSKEVLENFSFREVSISPFIISMFFCHTP